jgi:uncharacterized protein YndB with AHSA1/START domain
MHATYETVSERPTLTFERRLRHPVETVWGALTEPDQLARWFPSAIVGELREGAALSFEFPGHPEVQPMPGEVTEFDEPRVLSLQWGEDHLHFELEPADAGAATLLRLRVELGTSDKAARDAAGWHVCLDRLESGLGDPDAAAPGPEPAGEWQAHYENYADRFPPECSTAPVPPMSGGER